MGSKSDDIWLQQLSTGTDEAYELLFTNYYSSLGMFAYRYLNDRQKAEDAVHDVLLELYQNWEKFDTITSLKAYLYNSIKNRCLNILKHDKIHNRYATFITSSEQDFCDNRILEIETYELLKEAVNQLPEQTRKVYDLVLQGYDNPDIAKKLDLSDDAVKAHRKRGKKLLKDKLQHLLVFLLTLS